MTQYSINNQNQVTINIIWQVLGDLWVYRSLEIRYTLWCVIVRAITQVLLNRVQIKKKLSHCPQSVILMSNPKEYSSLAFKERTIKIGCQADPISWALSKNSGTS